jgi:DNA-binding IclR family transcriptional regulator
VADAPVGEPPLRGRRPPQGEPVVDRALALLGAFDADHPHLTLSELSRRSGIPTSSALRLACRLLAWGALERDPDGRFSVGLRLCEVAALSPRSQGLRRVAMPFMSDLGEATRQHALLAVRDGGEAFMVEQLSSHGAVATLYRPGSRIPLYSTGVGLVLLAFADSDLQEKVLARPLMHVPEMIPVSADELRCTLAEIRRAGFVTFRRAPTDVIGPLVSVAAPVRDARGAVVAAMSVLVPADSAEPRVLAMAVRAAARGVSCELGGTGIS